MDGPAAFGPSTITNVSIDGFNVSFGCVQGHVVLRVPSGRGGGDGGQRVGDGLRRLSPYGVGVDAPATTCVVRQRQLALAAATPGQPRPDAAVD